MSHYFDSVKLTHAFVLVPENLTPSLQEITFHLHDIALKMQHQDQFGISIFQTQGHFDRDQPYKHLHLVFSYSIFSVKVSIKVSISVAS